MHLSPSPKASQGDFGLRRRSNCRGMLVHSDVTEDSENWLRKRVILAFKWFETNYWLWGLAIQAPEPGYRPCSHPQNPHSACAATATGLPLGFTWP
jgi:hypothetical protein